MHPTHDAYLDELAKNARPSAARLLRAYGPPNEWSGAVAGMLGPQGRAEVTKLWRSLSKEEKAKALAAWRKAMREPEKTAADVRVMLQRLSNAKGVRVGPSMMAVQGGGAVSIANKRAIDPLLAHRQGKMLRFAEKLQGVGELLGERGSPLRDVAGGIREGARHMRRDALNHAGHIRVDPDLTEAATRVAAGGKKLAGEGKDAHTALVLGHEMSERRVKAHEVAPLYSHISPKVLLEEHGMLSRATGPGAADAVARLRAARAASGEAKHMQNLATTALRDPRAAQFFAEGEKVPKAMRKAILRKVQADPKLLQRTAPGVGDRLARAVQGLRKTPERTRAAAEMNQQAFRSALAAYGEP